MTASKLPLTFRGVMWYCGYLAAIAHYLSNFLPGEEFMSNSLACNDAIRLLILTEFCPRSFEVGRKILPNWKKLSTSLMLLNYFCSKFGSSRMWDPLSVSTTNSRDWSPPWMFTSVNVCTSVYLTSGPSQPLNLISTNWGKG